MTKRFFAVGLLIGLSIVMFASENKNTFLNLDFEVTGWNNTPRHWYTSKMVYTVKADDTVKYTGKYSLYMQGIKKGNSFGAATSQFPIEHAAGKKIRFSGFIKTEDVKDGYAGFWWRVDGTGKQRTLAFDNMAGRGAAGTSDWKEYVIEMDVPANGKGIFFGMLLIGSGKAWFDNIKITVDGKPYAQTKPVPVLPAKDEIKWLKANVIPLKSVEPNDPLDDLTKLKKIIGNRRIVALGEGTHGTKEFFKMKHRLVRFLAEEMGFTIFAIEANMPEARAVNKYILTGEGDPKKALAGMYFWTWNTQEVLDMIEWMRKFNQSGKGKIQFYGFDMQFPNVAAKSVLAFLKKADPGFLKEAEKQYEIVKKQYKEMTSSRNRFGVKVSEWHEAAKKVHFHLLDNREKYIKSIPAPEVDWAIQDANVAVQAAEAYIDGKRSRDKSMAENLNWILDHSPKGTKIVTWAHNGHVQRAGYSYQSMGHYLDKVHGDDQVIVGFAFHEGTYTAVGSKGLDVYGTSPSEPGSVEWYLHETGIPNLILDLSAADKKHPYTKWMTQKMDFRSIGAAAIDYAFNKRVITESFDLLIFSEKSTPTYCFRRKGIRKDKKLDNKQDKKDTIKKNKKEGKKEAKK